ncbi:transient receptor potential cation channel subfamily v member [Plakobranchus ocellatus]|uniref:Transient receptor potential cation channel subfamily v member n=1 Tax=Plakobranchus ocellatus TaxID=259542 RepID=A0AAV4DFN4_9GAST|nr:transient receptor potential cation channel subfamily v member [Plakobranchus ocellatus]
MFSALLCFHGLKTCANALRSRKHRESLADLTPASIPHALFWPPKMSDATPEEEVMPASRDTSLAGADHLEESATAHAHGAKSKRLSQTWSTSSLNNVHIAMASLGSGEDRSNSPVSFESPLALASKQPSTLPKQSLADLLGDEIDEDLFMEEVAQKTQVFMVGRQEAETEVVIDRLIQKEGNKDKALLHVVSDMMTESKVQMFVNTLLHRGAHPSFSMDGRHDEIAALLVKYMPNYVVRELFITYDKDSAECTLHDLLLRDMQQTALAVLDCMIDRLGQTEHARVYYHLLEADDKGRPPTHPKFDCASRSCLHLISKEGYKNLVLHLVVRLLIRRKWKNFARLRFQMNSFLFLLTLLCLTFSVVVGVTTSDPTVYDTPIQVVRGVFEAWSLLAAMATFCLELNQFRKHKLEYWRDPFNWIDLGSSSLLLTVCPLRFTDHQEQWSVFSIGYLLWTLRIFKYAAVFRQTGAYSQILWRIISHDFLQFTVVFLVILLAFTGSFVLSLRGENSLDLHTETSSFWQVLFTGVRILIEAEPVVEYTGPDGYRVMSCILMVCFLFVCCVVLLNILIAQLSDTYHHVQAQAQRGLELNRAWIITRVELNSLFIGQSYRISRYLESTELNLLTITNRLSRQEYALKRIQDQLDQLLTLRTGPSGPTQTRRTWAAS